jgi:ribosome maturation factor RimP
VKTGCKPVFVFVGENVANRNAKKKLKGGVGKAANESNRVSLKRQKEFADSVTRLAGPLCIDEGLELVHVEYQREPGGLTLRIYLDKPGGVTLEDCVEISRQLDDILDVHMRDAPPYRLEVSSPGVDRPVGKLKDYDRFAGHRAKVRTACAVNGRKNFTGVLVGVVDEKVRMQVDKEIVQLEYDNITRARLVNYNGEH